jgi:hypothetical protein
MALLYAYFGFVLLTWLSPSLFDLLLRLSKFGRHALLPDQVRGANVLLACLVVTLGFAAAALWRQDEFLFRGTLMMAVLSLPASAIFRCAAGWPRKAMMAITLALLAAILLVVLPGLFLAKAMLPKDVVNAHTALQQMLPFALLGSQFAASYLMGVRVKH